MKRFYNYLLTFPDSAQLDPLQVGICFGGTLNNLTMSQLTLFDEPEEEHKIDIVYVPHHRSTGLGNFYDFLQYYRNENNTFISLNNRTYFSEIEEVEIVKQLLFKFNKDTQEWDHKPVYNFRINSMLHDIYDYLNERSNHV